MKKLRISGVKVIGDIFWGTHFCQFYQTKEELMDILFPYLKAGLENNELCIWALPRVFETKKEVMEYLRKTIPELDIYLEKGKIEIILFKDWHSGEESPEIKRIIKYWIEKADQAVDNGYDGLRLVQDISWLKNDLKNLIDYEERLDTAIENRRITAMCTYSSCDFDANEIVCVALNHRFVLVKREKKWEKVENSRLKREEERIFQFPREAETKLKKENDNLGKLLEEKTVKLTEAYQSLKKTEKQLFQTQKMAHIGDWKWDISTGELYWSDEVYRIFGRDPDRFKTTYDAFLSSVHPGDQENLINAIKKGFNGKLQNIDYRIILPDGEERAVHTQARIVFDEKNIPVQAEGIVQDVTERKRVEEALRKSEEHYRMLFANMTEAFFLGEIICDKNGKPYDYLFLEINPAFESHTGVKGEQVLGRPHLEVFHKVDPKVIENYGQAALSGRPAHFEFFTHLTHRFLDIFVFSPEKGKFAAVFRDITGRKKIEEKTRQRAEEMETLMEVTPVAIWIGHDSQCNKITGNRMANKLYEAETEENVSANIAPVRRFFHNGQELIAEELPMQKAVFKDIDVRNEEIDVLLPSGKWRTLLGSASPLHDRDGHVRGSIAAFMDITERKRMEEALKKANETLEERVKERTIELEKAYSSLKESEKSLAEAQKMAHIGSWDWDLVTNELHASDEMCRIFGLNPEEFNASYEAFLNYVHPADRDYIIAAYKDVINGKNLIGTDYRIIRADGEERVVHGQGEVIFNGENVPVRMSGTAQDITERKRTEKALELSEERYRIIVEQTGQLVYDYNVEENKSDWAGNIEEITGYAPSKFRNMNFQFFLSCIHPEDEKMFLERHERFLTYGGTYRSEYRFKKDNGEYIYVEDQGVCLKDEKR